MNPTNPRAAGCEDSRAAPSFVVRWRGLVAALVLALAWAAVVAPTASAKVFLSQAEGLKLAFPDADRIETETYIVGAKQTQEIQARARSKLETRIVKFHAGYRGDELLGHAYIDIHTVRTLPEAFLVVIGPSGKVASLRVLAFHEPLDYMPTDRWFGQFTQLGLEERLRLGGDIHGIMGATLSARAVTGAVRRVLALWETLVKPGIEARSPTRIADDDSAAVAAGSPPLAAP